MYKKNKILAITLARGGSRGVKNINGKPLISYTINEANKSIYIDRYIVSTDSELIRKISIKYGADVPFLRPKKYATDRATSVDALVQAVNWIEKNDGQEYDIIVELMCTNPLKNYYDISKRKVFK